MKIAVLNRRKMEEAAKHLDDAYMEIRNEKELNEEQRILKTQHNLDLSINSKPSMKMSARDFTKEFMRREMGIIETHPDIMKAMKDADEELLKNNPKIFGQAPTMRPPDMIYDDFFNQIHEGRRKRKGFSL